MTARTGRCGQVSARPDLAQVREESDGWLVTLTPGRALNALLDALASHGLPVTGMTLTRLQGTVMLPGGITVRYCCGWLAWPTGRPSRQGRPLHTLHTACDPAGAARRLAATSRPGGTDPAS